MSGIYIHIPFCHKRCIYCDFYLVTNLSLKEKFLTSLHKEIDLHSPSYKQEEFNSIYFGGGTPSILSPIEIEQIISKIKSNFKISDNSEITLEANPEDILKTDVLKLKEAGINRFSLGIQSFDEDELKFLTREHTVKEAIETVEKVQAEFDNYSIDIIYSLPGQEISTLKKSLDKVIELNAPHVSTYALTFEPKTVLGKLLNDNKVSENPAEPEMYRLVSDYFTEKVYEHYEVSSFCKPGYEAKHNSKYWNWENYIGLGPSSHSFHNDSRWNNVKSMNEYFTLIDNGKLPQENIIKLSKDDMKFEFIITGLRSKGVNLRNYKKIFNEDFLINKEHVIKELTDNNFGILKNEMFMLTRKGFSLADEIITKYF